MKKEEKEKMKNMKDEDRKMKGVSEKKKKSEKKIMKIGEKN